MASHSPAADQIAFIDFEASGLGPFSWPIEVGWSFDDGVTDSVLISPAPDWPMTAWDPKAERLHGITPRMLADLGLDPAETCERLDAALGRRVSGGPRVEDRYDDEGETRCDGQDRNRVSAVAQDRVGDGAEIRERCGFEEARPSEGGVCAASRSSRLPTVDRICARRRTPRSGGRSPRHPDPSPNCR